MFPLETRIVFINLQKAGIARIGQVKAFQFRRVEAVSPSRSIEELRLALAGEKKSTILESCP